MFEQFTRTAADLANDAAGKAAELSTSAGAAAAKASTAVAQTTRSAATKIQNVQFDMTDLDLSGLTRFDPRKLGTLEFPKVDLPKVEFPKVNVPKVNVPRVEFPKVNVPKVDVPAEVDRVADVVRDVAYAGLGAAVITAQQVDANVRRLASRAS
jgi:hypothetical protein